MRKILPRYPNQDKIVLGVTDENGAFYKGVLVGAGGLIAFGLFLNSVYGMRK
jgi:hypothetical protein